MRVEIDGHPYIVEAQIEVDPEMAWRAFDYCCQLGTRTKNPETGEKIIRFPGIRVIYLEGGDRVPEKETLQLETDDGEQFTFVLKTLRLLGHSIGDLEERGLGLLFPFYLLKVRGRVREAETPEARRALAGELEGLVEEIGEALERTVERGLMTTEDKKKVLEYLDLLWGEVYGEYNEFKEAKMNAFEKINVRVDREFARMAKAEARGEARGIAKGEAKAKAEWKDKEKQMEARIKYLEAQLAGGGGGGSPH